MKAEDLPKMRCDDNCGECCGITFANRTEYGEIKKYMLEHGIRPKRYDSLRCPLYQDGKCSVYPVRPLLCRIFGHSESLVCSRGYNKNVADRKIRKMLHNNIDGDMPIRYLLHEKEFCRAEEKAEEKG